MIIILKFVIPTEVKIPSLIMRKMIHKLEKEKEKDLDLEDLQ